MTSFVIIGVASLHITHNTYTNDECISMTNSEQRQALSIDVGMCVCCVRSTAYTITMNTNITHIHSTMDLQSSNQFQRLISEVSLNRAPSHLAICDLICEMSVHISLDS